MKKLTLLAFLVPLLMAQVWASDGAVKNIPLVRLLASSSQFNNIAVSVTGVLHRDGNGTLALYLDEGSARHDIYENGVQLELTNDYEGGGFKKIEAAVMNKYVIVYGTVDTSSPHPRLYSGVISNVDEIRAYPLLRNLPSQ